MDFLRLLSDDLQVLRGETKKKYPVVKEAVDKALETLPYLQKQYAALLRVETAPGPGHPLFKSESVLRPFLLACNHTNASHKVIILALVSIQRLVSWDAIEQSSVGSILRVLQIQAEKNTHADVQVKLLQTLLQLVTLGFQDKNETASSSSVTSSAGGSDPAENALVGSEDLVMQAVWICIHLHGSSSSASSVVGNTAAMTIRQVVSLAFGKVHTSPEAKRVGVLVFQELCFMSREENGVWLKRTATSSMSVALAVELLEAILAAHSNLFRADDEFYAVLKQHVCSLIQSALETGCAAAETKHSASITASALSSLGSSNNSGGSSGTNSGGISAPFFPLLVRVMRLASVVICNFSDVLPEECSVILTSLLEIVSTGAYHQPGSMKSPSHAKLIAQEAKSFISHHSGSGSAGGGSSGNHSHPANTSYVTWPVLLALEVINKLSLEPTTVIAVSSYAEPMLRNISHTVSCVATTSPPSDFRVHGTDIVVSPRSGLEFLNDQDAPPLQPFFGAIRVAVTSLSNLIASVFDLSRMNGVDAAQSDKIAKQCVNIVSPYCLQAFAITMRYCREVELIQTSLKSYHVLATIASRLRSNLSNSTQLPSTSSSGMSSQWEISSRRMDEIALACFRALCAFSFPLPESAKGASGKIGSASGNNISSANGSANTALNDSHGDSDGHGEETESCVVTLTWREVHAMKALFSAAHIMQEEMIEGEWCCLLDAFEIIVGLADGKVKGGQNKVSTKSYRIGSFHIEDEDVEQQLVMLSNSIVELFRDALKLSSTALRRLTAALRKVCWDQLGLPLQPSSQVLREAGRNVGNVAVRSDDLNSGDQELPMISAAHQMKTYQNYLGVGLAGSGTYLPSFALRMLTQLATNSKKCFEDVIDELLVMVTFSLQPPATPSQYPQLNQFQVFATDSILQLMQRALQNVINSLSPTTKLPNDATLEQMEQHSKLYERSEPHVFDQQELFKPLVKLMRSDMKDRALAGILDLLNSCGHLINIGWPLVLQSVQEACELGDAKTQLVAFKCLRVIVDDLLVSIPRMYLRNCLTCIGRFACCAKDVNISLTAVNELWSVADIIGKSKVRSPPVQVAEGDATIASYWACAFAELALVAMDDRTEVRNCSINTLFGAGVTYGIQFELSEWKLFIDETVLPLTSKLHHGPSLLSNGNDSVKVPIVMHHSRDNAQKQWDESRVLMLNGISRVLQTNCSVLLSHSEWFSGVWTQLLKHIALNSESAQAKEVVLAAINTLQTLLQVSSSADFDQIAQSQPVRVGAGMRVVGGALVSTAGMGSPLSSVTATGTKRLPAHTQPHFVRNPALWESAFAQLLRLCDQRYSAKLHLVETGTWKEEDELEIASAIVSVVVTLYSQAKEFEFKDERNVFRIIALFETLVMRHVLTDDVTVKALANVTSNSLQSRVLNAFEECGSFAAHPEVHERALDQLVRYVNMSASRDLVFFTRHALISLAKLYASVSTEARRDCFQTALGSVRLFLQPNGGTSGVVPDMKPLSAAQKAASQLWKHALRVLLVLISHGLAAVRLETGCWRSLLDTITEFLTPSTGQLPSFVQGEEDEALVLSVLECLIDSAIALLSGPSGNKIVADTPSAYQQFIDALMILLCSGIDGTKNSQSKPLIRCCVRQLATLGIQQEDERLSALARTHLVRCCDASLRTFASLEESTAATTRQSDPSDVSGTVGEGLSTNFDALAARDRVVILLGSASEVGLSPRNVLEMFPALCTCITSSDLDVRKLIQRLLLQTRVAEFCLDVLDVHEATLAAAATSSRTGSGGHRTDSSSWNSYA